MKKGTVIDALTGVFAIIGMACLGYLGLKYGEPAPKTPPRRDYRDYGEPYWRSEPVHYSGERTWSDTNPSILAIEYLLKEAKQCLYSSDKIGYAEQIFDIVSDLTFPSDKVKGVAIEALRDISATMSSVSDRVKVSYLVADIAVM